MLVAQRDRTADGALLAHWPEYAIEAALLGAFMVSACAFTVLLEHPASPLRNALPDDSLRRALIGIAMGATAVCLIHSPWGQRSGAHFNPSVTLTFLRLGKIGPRDALAYVAFQCAGAILGVALSRLALGDLVAHPAVAYAVTVPGERGAAVAFVAEAAISFGMMSTVLLVSNGRYARATGLACGALVALYVAFEAPLSGMSMNAARSLGSAVAAGVWSGFWIYLTAPLLGMLAAAELFVRARGSHRILCARLDHSNPRVRCIFRCRRGAVPEA
jgi:aquaporin Z